MGGLREASRLKIEFLAVRVCISVCELKASEAQAELVYAVPVPRLLAKGCSPYGCSGSLILSVRIQSDPIEVTFESEVNNCRKSPLP